MSSWHDVVSVCSFDCIEMHHNQSVFVSVCDVNKTEDRKQDSFWTCLLKCNLIMICSFLFAALFAVVVNTKSRKVTDFLSLYKRKPKQRKQEWWGSYWWISLMLFDVVLSKRQRISWKHFRMCVCGDIARVVVCFCHNFLSKVLFLVGVFITKLIKNYAHTHTHTHCVVPYQRQSAQRIWLRICVIYIMFIVDFV